MGCPPKQPIQSFWSSIAMQTTFGFCCFGAATAVKVVCTFRSVTGHHA